MKQYVYKLKYVFRNKGVKYDLEEDFNDTGEFHGILSDKWSRTLAGKKIIHLVVNQMKQSL